jgi:hypothetical protein
MLMHFQLSKNKKPGGILLSLLFLLINLDSFSQNLVVNGDFETYLSYSSPIGNAVGWRSPTMGSPDYLHSYNTNASYRTPLNLFGFQYARSGQAYAGFAVRSEATMPIYANLREYPMGTLTDTLIANGKYCVKFYISLSDSSKWAINKMGIFFTKNIITHHDSTFYHNMNVVPDIQFEEKFYSDTADWIELSGLYTAEGGERYFIIGNFAPDSLTDTLATGIDINWGVDFSYYYIDDVSIERCDTMVGNNEINEVIFEVYPNPANEFLTIETKSGFATAQIYDIQGRKLQQFNLNNSKEQINISDLKPGMYIVSVMAGKQQYRRKLLIE